MSLFYQTSSSIWCPCITQYWGLERENVKNPGLSQNCVIWLLIRGIVSSLPLLLIRFGY